jgi:hypothetical protein
MSLAKTMWTGLFTIAPSLGSEKYTLGPPVDAGAGELEVHAALAARAAVMMKAPTTRKDIAQTPFEEPAHYRLNTRPKESGPEDGAPDPIFPYA